LRLFDKAFDKKLQCFEISQINYKNSSRTNVSIRQAIKSEFFLNLNDKEISNTIKQNWEKITITYSYIFQ